MSAKPLITLATVAVAVMASTATAAAAGSVSIAGSGIPYSENFDTLASAGTSNITLPTGWDLAETGINANGAYAAGNGTSNAGDVYSYGALGSIERAFGTLQSGSLIPTIGESLTNNTGAQITALSISYTGEQWRLGASGRGPDRLDFQYSEDATSLFTGVWTDVDVLDFSSPITSGTVGALNGNNAGSRVGVAATISGLAIPNGASFWIRWTDFNVASSDDGLAVDDFSITASGPSSSGYPRPKSATPITASLVPAYEACTAPNRVHGPPALSGASSDPSCAPPVQRSPLLTVGTPDANGAGANSTGYVKARVIVGDPTTPADEADVSLVTSVTDVRCSTSSPPSACGSANAAAGSDYTGQLRLHAAFRMTDKLSGASQTEPATVEDLVLTAVVPCTSSAGTHVGSTCAVTTTFDTLTPGWIKETKRTILQFEQLELFDGGADGVASTSDADSNALAVQGVFVP